VGFCGYGDVTGLQVERWRNRYSNCRCVNS